MLKAELATPIFVRARTRPMVRTNSPMACFCTANTCSTGARSRERLSTFETSVSERLTRIETLLEERLPARR